MIVVHTHTLTHTHTHTHSHTCTQVETEMTELSVEIAIHNSVPLSYTLEDQKIHRET